MRQWQLATAWTMAGMCEPLPCSNRVQGQRRRSMLTAEACVVMLGIL